jgi:predicted amidophosphoribosyltransferase
MHIRYCVTCEQEFRPEILRCSDCGGDLEDRYEEDAGEGSRVEKAETAAPDLQEPPAEYLPVFACRNSQSLKEAADCLAAASIPFRATGSGSGFQLLVRAQDGPTALVALRGREGTAGPDDDSQPFVGMEGGVCPACGANVPAGVLECPGCALVVGAEAARCDSCGSPLGPADVQCPVCRAPEG